MICVKILAASGSEDACMKGFNDCNLIFNSIMDIAGDINVRTCNFFQFFFSNETRVSYNYEQICFYNNLMDL